MTRSCAASNPGAFEEMIDRGVLSEKGGVSSHPRTHLQAPARQSRHPEGGGKATRSRDFLRVTEAAKKAFGAEDFARKWLNLPNPPWRAHSTATCRDRTPAQGMSKTYWGECAPWCFMADAGRLAACPRQVRQISLTVKVRGLFGGRCKNITFARTQRAYSLINVSAKIV